MTNQKLQSPGIRAMANKLLAVFPVRMTVSEATQFIVATILCVGLVGLLWMGRPVPGELYILTGAVVGYFFGKNGGKKETIQPTLPF